MKTRYSIPCRSMACGVFVLTLQLSYTLQYKQKEKVVQAGAGPWQTALRASIVYNNQSQSLMSVTVLKATLSIEVLLW